jgi:hypothetical protein
MKKTQPAMSADGYFSFYIRHASFYTGGGGRLAQW